MYDFDDQLTEDYLSECGEHLETMEANLMALEKGDEGSMELVFRAVCAIKGGAGDFDLVKVCELARQTEEVLSDMLEHRLPASPERVRVLLSATDGLRDLIQRTSTSSDSDITGIVTELGKLHSAQGGSAEKAQPPAVVGPCAKRLKILLAEDDFTSRFLLQTFLSRFGECHVAVNGQEAVTGFRAGLENGEPYDLICMDIMMPEMDGREAARQIRNLEKSSGIPRAPL